MAKIGRPIFKRHLEYVAVRRIRLSSKEFIEPGEDVKLRTHQMRSLYSRRRIGVKGHPWTERALKCEGFPKSYAPEEAPKVEPVNDGLPWVIVGTDKRFKNKGDAKAWLDESPVDDAEIKRDNLVWEVPGEDVRFAKKADALAWIEEAEKQG